jgi:periplasmic protein TonB
MNQFLKMLIWAILLGFGASLYAQEPKDASAPPAPLQNPTEQQPKPPERIRIMQGVTQGLLIRKVQPKYPKEARKKHVQGSVLMHALISKTGEVADLQLISGDALLVPSALKAVKQWKYKPYLLEGQAVEVETEITVNYALTP